MVWSVEGDTPEAADDNDVPERPADKYDPESKVFCFDEKFMLYEW